MRARAARSRGRRAERPPPGRAQVRETLRDVQFLHNDQFFAAAQRKYVYIYDKRGVEVHCLKARARARPRAAPCCMVQSQYVLELRQADKRDDVGSRGAWHRA